MSVCVRVRVCDDMMAAARYLSSSINWPDSDKIMLGKLGKLIWVQQ